MINYRDLHRTKGLARLRELMEAYKDITYCPYPEDEDFVVHEIHNEQWTMKQITYKGKLVYAFDGDSKHHIEHAWKLVRPDLCKPTS